MGSKVIRANQLWNTKRNLYSPMLLPLGRAPPIDPITAPRVLFQSGKERERPEQMSTNGGIWTCGRVDRALARIHRYLDCFFMLISQTNLLHFTSDFVCGNCSQFEVSYHEDLMV